MAGQLKYGKQAASDNPPCGVSTLAQAVTTAHEVLALCGRDELEKTIWSSPAGKKRLASRLAAMLPAHKTYVEPFAGSAAVLFTKEPAEVEAIGDADPEIAAAYRTIKGLSSAQLARPTHQGRQSRRRAFRARHRAGAGGG